MKVQQQPPLHLTYCLNVHPGETWAENFAAIREKALAVKTRVAPGQPFGLGLRLSRVAADSLASGARLRDVRKFLDDHGLYVFTINGFPYGRFHGARVKEQVYAPDWRAPERREYTERLADILAQLLPDDVAGSISTVPVSFKPWIETGSDLAAALTNLRACAEHLAGSRICLALEPEPGCILETAGETIRFFGEHFPGEKHIGVCFDTCHAAVEFEDPAESLRQIAAAGIRVAKVQLSAALEMAPDAVARVPFHDAVYLHQTKAERSDGSFQYWNDLPDAVAAVSRLHQSASAGPADRRGLEYRRLRVHFHVPLFFKGGDAAQRSASTGEDRDLRARSSDVRSTAEGMDGDFFELVRQGVTEHLEIETYTFDVLPESLRAGGVVDAVVREFEWVVGKLERGA